MIFITFKDNFNRSHQVFFKTEDVNQIKVDEEEFNVQSCMIILNTGDIRQIKGYDIEVGAI